MCRGVVLSLTRALYSQAYGKDGFTVLFSTTTRLETRTCGHGPLTVLNLATFVAVQRMSLALVVLTALVGALGLRVALPLSDLRGCLLPLLAALEPASGKVALAKFSLIFKAARRFARKIVLLPIQARYHDSVAPHELVHRAFAEYEDGLPANVVARTERRNRSSSGEGTGAGVVVDPRRARSAKATPVLRFLSRLLFWILPHWDALHFRGSFSCKRTALSIFVLFLPFFLASEGGTQREAQSLLRLLRILIKVSPNKYHTRPRNRGVVLVSRGFLENRKSA